MGVHHWVSFDYGDDDDDGNENDNNGIHNDITNDMDDRDQQNKEEILLQDEAIYRPVQRMIIVRKMITIMTLIMGRWSRIIHCPIAMNGTINKAFDTTNNQE